MQDNTAPHPLCVLCNCGTLCSDWKEKKINQIHSKMSLQKKKQVENLKSFFFSFVFF